MEIHTLLSLLLSFDQLLCLADGSETLKQQDLIFLKELNIFSLPLHALFYHFAEDGGLVDMLLLHEIH